MKSVIAAALLFALAQSGSNRVPASAPLDVCWLPELGRVSVTTTDATHFSIVVESDGITKEQPFEIDSSSAGSKLLAAKIGAGPFYGKGMLIALSIQDGATTAYRFLISPTAPLSERPLRTSELSVGDSGWRLSKEIFRSTGDPYRIVDVHGFNDNFDITFRRGWGTGWGNDPRVTEVKFDEKVLFNGCFGGIQSPEMRSGQLCENGIWHTLS